MLFATVLVSFWFRYDFEGPEQRARALQAMDLEMAGEAPAEPYQAENRASAFETEREGVVYTVRPLYDYALQGIVVSMEQHDGDFGLHRRWNDHLNVADLCVVWGENATSIDLDAFDFWNGEFTCNFRVGSRALWERFRQDQLSNNHLLADADWLRDRVRGMKVGDVVTLRGQLAEYATGGGPPRTTSTTRADSGNGACEVLYLEDARVVGNVRTFWYPLFWFGLWGALVAAVVWLYGVARGHH